MNEQKNFLIQSRNEDYRDEEDNSSNESPFEMKPILHQKSFSKNPSKIIPKIPDKKKTTYLTGFYKHEYGSNRFPLDCPKINLSFNISQNYNTNKYHKSLLSFPNEIHKNDKRRISYIGKKSSTLSIVERIKNNINQYRKLKFTYIERRLHSPLDFKNKTKFVLDKDEERIFKPKTNSSFRSSKFDFFRETHHPSDLKRKPAINTCLNRNTKRNLKKLSERKWATNIEKILLLANPFSNLLPQMPANLNSKNKLKKHK